MTGTEPRNPRTSVWLVGDLVTHEEWPDQPVEVLEVEEMNECCGEPEVRVITPEGEEDWWCTWHNDVKLVAGPPRSAAVPPTSAFQVGDVVACPAEWPGAELPVVEIDNIGCEESGWAPIVWVSLPDDDEPTWRLDCDLTLIRRHEARPDDLPEPGNRCKECAAPIVWMGPGHDAWLHVDDPRNR